MIGFTWVHLGSLGFTWVHLGLLGFTWVYLGYSWLICESLDIWCRIWKMTQTHTGFLGYLEILSDLITNKLKETVVKKAGRSRTGLWSFPLNGASIKLGPSKDCWSRSLVSPSLVRLRRLGLSSLNRSLLFLQYARVCRPLHCTSLEVY